MAIIALSILKNYFKKYAYPTEQQFHDALDSFVHKDDKIGIGAMSQEVIDTFNNKAEQTALAAEVAARQNDVRELGDRIDALGAETLVYDESDFSAREIADGTYIRIYTCPAHFDGSTLIRAVMEDLPDGGVGQDILELCTNAERDTCRVINKTGQTGYGLYTRYNSDDDTLEVYRRYSDEHPVKLYVWKEEGDTGEWELTPLDEEDPDYEDIISELQPASSAIAQAIAGKQDTLTFDTVPTEGSENPVTSGGIFTLFSEGYKTVSLVLDPQGATPPGTAMSVTTGTETQFGWTWAFPELSKKWCRLSSDGLYLTVLERGIYRIEGVVCVTASSTSRVMTMRCVKTVEGITSTIDVTFGGTTSSGSSSNPTIVPICPIEVKTSGGDPGDNNEGYGLKFSFNFNGDVTFGAGTRLIITKTADL